MLTALRKSELVSPIPVVSSLTTQKVASTHGTLGTGKARTVMCRTVGTATCREPERPRAIVAVEPMCVFAVLAMESEPVDPRL